MAEEIEFQSEIERLLEREPFMPFTVILTSGDRYEVVGAHSLAIGTSNTVVVIHPRSGLSFFRKSQIVGVDAPEPVV